MIKVVSLLKRPPTVATAEEFKEWWLRDHAPLAARIPEALSYSIAFPIDETGFPFDGMAEIHFADLAALERGFASDAGRVAVESAARHAGSRVRAVMTEIKVL